MRAVLDKSLARHHQNENEKLENLKKEHKKFIRAPMDKSITNISKGVITDNASDSRPSRPIALEA